ncbi:trypco2 family protein [Streptomyces sp. NBC_00212]|uniref:trypco2 family protein n=1 Tax=Streptomyces sp. NBC_00212 TaxID=2975684 RepID=UPI0032550AF7
MEFEPTELSEAIKAVRGVMAAAQRDGDGSPVRFTVKEIVLDLRIEHTPRRPAAG